MPLSELVAIGWRGRHVLAAALLLPLLGAVASSQLAAPRYEADGSLLVKTGREYMAREEGQVNAQSAPQTTKQEDLDSEIEIMRSRPVADAVLGRVGIGRMFPRLMDVPEPLRSDEAATRFATRLSIRPVRISDVVDVSYRARDPLLASRVLGAFLDAYNARHLAVFSPGDLGRVYETVIRRDLAELDRLEHARETIKLTSGIYDVDAQRQSLIAERADATEELQRDRRRAAALASRIETLAAAARTTDRTEVATETDRSDGGEAADGALVELERSRSELLSRYAPDHPLVRQVDSQLAALRAARPDLSRPITRTRHDPSPVLRSVEQELVVDRAELAPLADEIDRTGRDVAGFGRELARIEEADTALRTVVTRIDSIHENMKGTRAELEKARTLDGLDNARALSVSVIEAPVASHRPVWPNGPLFVVAGLVAGVLAAGAVLLGLVLSQDGVLTGAGLEALLGERVLASVTRSGALPPF